MDTESIEISAPRVNRRARPRRILSAAVLLITVALVGTGVASVPTSPATAAAARTVTPAPALADAAGLHVLEAVRADPRHWRVEVASDAVADPVSVNVLLPAGYDTTQRRYPTLFLYHGTSGSADDWLTEGHAARATAKLPLIVVSPDTGVDGTGGSWFTNWVDQHTTLGAANWETLLVDQLVPWVDATFRTRADRSGRAVAGLSQGGFGSMSFAARHPDLFVSAASFSGAPDIARHPLAAIAGALVVGAIMTGLNQVQPFAPFGDPVLDRIVWQGHNPADLVTNLADTDVELWAGNGLPGPFDDVNDPVVTVGGAPVEVLTHTSTVAFVQAARHADVPVRLRDYGPGTHTFPYWARDLREYLPRLLRVFAQRRPTPATIGYRSIERRWTQWGWTVTNDRARAHRWSALRRASARGFVLAGAVATVTTPPLLRPGARYRVRADGGRTAGRVRADDAGRLRLRVASDTGHTRVRITRVR